MKWNITHGISETPTYNTYRSMLHRCLNKNDVAYSRYGGAGITVCKRWLKIENFIEDMGLRPKGKSLERINGKLGYYKKNCRWATRREQSRNMRTNTFITYNGKTLCISDWAAEVGISRTTIRMRIQKYGWTVDEALSTKCGKWTKKKKD